MQLTTTMRRLAWMSSIPFAILAYVAALGTPAAAQSCVDCGLFAATELNLRQEPSLEGVVLRFIPAGAAVQRTAEPEVNGYAPVIYDSVPGWAIALGLVATPQEIESVGGGAAAGTLPGEPPVSSESTELRFTLVPLVLRSGPDPGSEPILVMPEGATVTLTREGAVNGYVTVDFQGTRGWAYADLLGGDR